MGRVYGQYIANWIGCTSPINGTLGLFGNDGYLALRGVAALALKKITAPKSVTTGCLKNHLNKPRNHSPASARNHKLPIQTLMPTLSSAQILAVVRNIPQGFVASYGDIAARCGAPSNARQVGAVLRDYNNDDGLNPAPWHRVVNAQGAISERIFNWQQGSDLLQKVLLEDEGVEFILTGKKPRVNMKKFQWKENL